MGEVSKYTALIKQAISQNILMDESMRGKSCVINISLASSGFVTRVVPGSGDRQVCDAAVKAVYKAGTLPVSKDPDVFKEMKNTKLTYKPEF